MLVSKPDKIDQILKNPQWLPFRLDVIGGNIGFIRIKPEQVSQATFLDSRIAQLAGAKAVMKISALEAALAATGFQALGIPRIPRFIFHSAFCCSTLLSRALGVSGHSMSMREPMPLRDLADAKRAGHLDEARSKKMTALLVRLLDRHAKPTETLVIKPSNLCNNLIGELLGQTECRALFMSGNVKSFLISVLKKGPSMHQKLPWLLDQVGRDVSYLQRTGMRPERIHNALQYAAMIWHAQRLRLESAVANDEERLRTLDQDDLLAAPADTLSQSQEFLELPWGPETVGQVLHGRVFKTHAKEPTATYSARIRARENVEIERRYEVEIQAAQDWLQPLLERLPVANSMGNRLAQWKAPMECRRAMSL